MGYEDARIIGRIKDSDRCNLCNQLCSIDLFIETKCFHLFCAECFSNYLKQNSHSGEIRDESNYNKLYHPVRCPVSNKILQFNHTKGALYHKMKQYFIIGRYKIRCEFYPICDSEIRISRLSQHYSECFFTARRTENDYEGYNRDVNLFQSIDFCASNQLNEKSNLKLIDGLKCKKDGNLQVADNHFLKGQIGLSQDRIQLRNRSFYDLEELNKSIENLKFDDNDVQRYEIDDYTDVNDDLNLIKNDKLKFNGDHFDKKDEKKQERLSFSECLIVENVKLKNTAINLLIDQDADEYQKLKKQLTVLEKNVNFIKEQLLPQMRTKQQVVKKI